MSKWDEPRKKVPREGKQANKWREDDKQNRMPGFADCHGVLLDPYGILITWPDLQLML